MGFLPVLWAPLVASLVKSEIYSAVKVINGRGVRGARRAIFIYV